MRRLPYIIVVLVMLRSFAPAATYYVSSSAGNDANSGTSSGAAWQTIAHVNAQTFQPGDSILFKRGDVWNESLVPPSSGTSGNPITLDAYGTGPAPNLTGYYAVPSSAWVLVSGNAWKAPLPLTYSTVNFCLFGSIWGQKVSAVSTNLTAQWDFYFANGYIYVYSAVNPSTYYNEPIVPMALSNTPVININNQTWLTFQHFLINWFDQYGVYVQGTSDHLVFANMESDSMIPQGTQPLGFYVDETAPGPGNIKIYNSEAHLNYDGFRFDGTATSITMINDKAYANRDGALVDNTGAVTYSYCHFYASSLAVAGSTDVEYTSGIGPTASAGNIPQDTPPAVEVYQRYPAIVTLTVDDSGMTAGADTYYSGTVLPIADAAGIPVGAAITVGYPLAQTLISEFQSWINAGRDVTAHSISHTYYTNTDALDLQYIGSGTAASLSISDDTFTITVTGATTDSVTYNLARGQPQGTMLALAQALAATGKYTYSFATPCQGPYGTGCAAYTAAALLSQDLADVSNQDVKTSVYHAQLNVAQLTNDEITLSRQWMTTNLTGLPSTPVYVYPGGYETTTMQGTAEDVPYSGARGALKEDLGVKDTYADGFNVQNITSFGVNPSWMGLEPSVLNQKIQALVWKESLWGVPWGIFWHLNELTQDDPVGGTEITNLINDFKNAGATVKTNTNLVNWLLTGTQETGTDGNYYYKIPATSMTLDFRPTETSPVVDAGANLGTAYELDINGVNQNSYGAGWEIGAYVYQGYATYGNGSGTGNFTIGLGLDLSIFPTLPQVWVNNNEYKSAITSPNYTVAFPSSGTGGSWTCAADSTTNGPYTAGSASSLQTAVNDVEACRTASGGTSSFLLEIPPALYPFGNYGLIVPQTNSTVASSWIAVISTADSNLPDGRTIGAHGIEDNNPESIDIGLNNPDLTGQNMYVQSGPTEVLQAASGNANASQATSSICPGSVACLTTFTLASGNFASGFTPGTIVAGRGFGSSGDEQQNYNSMWIIVSGGAGTNSLNAVPWGCYIASPNCNPYVSSVADVSGTAVTWVSGSDFQTLYGGEQIQIAGHNATISSSWSPTPPYETLTLANTFTSCSTNCALVGNQDATAGLTATATADEGTLQPDGTISGITTLSVNTTTLLPVGGTYDILPTGTALCIPLANGFVAAGVSVTVDTGANQETVTTQSGPCQKGMYATLAKAHAVGTPVTLCAAGCNYTLANGNSISTASYDDLASMWQVIGSGAAGSGITFCTASGITGYSGPQCLTNLGPDHWYFADGAAAQASGGTADGAAIELGQENDSAYTQMPTSIYFNKMWIHGDWPSAFTGANSTANGLHLQCLHCAMLNSQESEVMRPGGEGHAVSCGIGQQFKVVHNWLEGLNGWICGGFSSTISLSGWMPGQDMEIRRNRFTDPYAWLGLSGANNNVDPNVPSSFSFVRKNGFELKVANRFVLQGNIIENIDNSGAQNGEVENARANNGSNTNGVGNYWFTTSNGYRVGNVVRNGCAGPGSQGRSQQPQADSNGSGAAFGETNILYQNELYYNISYDNNPGCPGSDSYGWHPGSGQVYWQGVVTVVSSGVATFTGYCGSGASGSCPATPWSSGVTPNLTLGWQQASMNVGDLVQITGLSSGQCSAFATPTVTSGSTTIPGLGTPALSVVEGGSNSNPPVISFAVSSSLTIGTTDSTGECVLNYAQGWPNNMIVDHVTSILGDNYAWGTGSDYSSGPPYHHNLAIRDSFMIGGGGWGSGNIGTGTIMEQFCCDVTSMSNDHTVWPGQSASNYTEYGNNPIYADSAGCTGTGCNPPVTMYFPVNSCIGWVGACSSGVPLSYPDYHSFNLSPSSLFYAGNSEAASDGTSMGANISVIDSDQTLNTFICPWACGSPGPYPDH